jgi:hypothetical protein
LRKRVLKIGLIMLVVGIVVSAVGLFAGDSLIHTYTDFTLDSASGLYVSQPLNLSSSAAVTVIGISSSPKFYFMNQTSYDNYANVTSPSSSNISSHSLSPSVDESIAGTDEQIFDAHVPGTYYLISFSAPNISYSIDSNLLQAAIYGFLLVIGILMAIAGFVLTIVGLAMRPKMQNPDDLMAQYEKKNQ